MMSIREYADKCGVSYTTCRKWIAQGRVLVQKVGRATVVLSEDRPEPLPPGSLSETARKQWNYGRRYVPGSPSKAAK